ncbi:MAG TPA: alpha-amylase family glycosyl hydrolase [Bacteroidota bacterium]|nr:alpha-amylase family glycosyl hydrolase [Bacteroidota bacterium]
MTLIAALTLLTGNETLTAQSAHGAGAPSWVRDAVFYQIFPERFANGDTANDPAGTERWGGTPTPGNFFGGDLRGIIGRLDYIASLGVNAIYLNPIFASPSNHKYNTADYMRIDPAFGDERTFRELVDSCHARGIRIILDGVFNHTGVDFFAFADLKNNGAGSKYRDWYNVRSFPVGPPEKPNYECWWGIGTLPKLMTGNPAVRRYLFDVTRHWLEAGADGWRLDVPNEIPHEFWKEWRTVVRRVKGDAYILGEIWDDGSPWLGGDEFDAVMNYRFRSSCIDFFAAGRSTVGAFDSSLARVRADYGDGPTFSQFNLLGSHDTERFLTLCSGDVSLWKLALLFQMTYPGAPSLYYGDEVGMTGGKDPACRGTMVWDPARQNGGMLAYTREVIALRRGHEVLRRGSFAPVIIDDAARLYAYARESAEHAALVVINRSGTAASVNISRKGVPRVGAWRVIWPQGAVITGDTVNVPPVSGVVLEGEK